MLPALEEGAGHQIYGNWQVCQFNDKDAPFPRACVDENARADPGFFGFWPEVNRARAYWRGSCLPKIPLGPRLLNMSR